MPEYGYIDEGLPGLLYGLDNQVEGGYSAAVELEFGRPVFVYPGDEKSLYPFLQDTVKSVYSVDLVTGNLIDINVNGADMVQVPFNTDHDTTMDDIITALNNMTGVDAVLDADDANNRTLIIRTKGATAVVTNVVTGGAGQPTVTNTSTTAQIFVGITARTANAPGVYEVKDAVNVLIDGYVWGTTNLEVKAHTPAYVATGGTLSDSTGIAIGGRYFTNGATSGLVVCQVTGKLNLGVSALF